MEAQLITIRDMVAANRLAIKEGRLQAFMRPDSSSGKWMSCRNLIGELEDHRGCAMGVTLNDEVRNRYATESIFGLAGRGIVCTRSKMALNILVNTQALHDVIARGEEDRRFYASGSPFPGKLGNFKTATPPTIDDYNRWLDLVEEYTDEIEKAA